MKGAELLIQTLEAEDVDYIFGVPGEENLDLLDALSRSKRIRLVLTRHEQAAGFMAATFGRLTGRPGVCLATLGPGATNLVTPAAYAQLGAMPMVMITGQKPVKRSKQGQFQIIDVVDMMAPITKYTRQIVSADSIPARVREAFRVAAEERPGATHLELPEDIAAEVTDERPIAASYARRPVAESKAVSHALELLERARHPLLVIGAGANRKMTARMLRAFVDKQRIPFVTTQMGKGVIDENHPCCIGNAAVSQGDFPHRATDAADLIIKVGHDVIEKPPFVMKTGERKVIHVNFQAAQVDRVYFPQVSVIGDIANSIWQMTEQLDPQPHWDFTFMMKVRDAMRAHIRDGSDSDAYPLKPQRLVRDVRAALPDDGVIALDNGIYKIWFARNYNAASPNTVLLDNALAAMGAGLPSAMAAKLLNPNRPVIAICGDGGFMMNSQELETAVRLKLNLIVLVLNDGAYGMVKWKQQHMGLAEFGLDFGNPDFVAYAAAYGATGHRIASAGELVPAIRKAVEDGGVQLIDVPVDYSDNDRILNREIPALSEAL
jgi:acetolactate synthase I/II/III large subunit